MSVFRPKKLTSIDNLFTQATLEWHHGSEKNWTLQSMVCFTCWLKGELMMLKNYARVLPLSVNFYATGIILLFHLRPSVYLDLGRCERILTIPEL